MGPEAARPSRLVPATVALLFAVSGFAALVSFAPVAEAAISHLPQSRDAAYVRAGPNPDPLRLELPEETEVTSRDVLLAQVMVVGPPSTCIVPPPGWALVRQDDDGASLLQAVYYRVADSTDVAETTYDWAFRDGCEGALVSRDALGGLTAFRGLDTNAPIHAHAGAMGVGPTPTTPQVQSQLPNTWVVCLFGLAADSAFQDDPPAGFIELFDKKYAKGSIEGNAKAQSGAGTLGPYSRTAGKSGANVGQVLVLQGPRASFVQSSEHSGPEATRTVPVSVRIAATSAATAVSFSVEGTATQGAGQDYTITASPLVIPAGQTTGVITITVNDDSLPEPAETVILTLTSSADAHPGPVRQYTYAILNDDGDRIAVASHPVDAAGVLQTGAAWGAWAADPGATDVTATNYLKVTNLCRCPVEVSVAFTNPANGMVGTVDPGVSVPLNGHVQFAAWEDTTPDATAPNESGAAYGFGPPAATGSATFRLKGESVLYVLYRLDSVPDNLLDQAYQASFTVTEA